MTRAEEGQEVRSDPDRLDSQQWRICWSEPWNGERTAADAEKSIHLDFGPELHRSEPLLQGGRDPPPERAPGGGPVRHKLCGAVGA
jgi:hypothetical protein